LTDEQAAQLAALYNQVCTSLKLGDIVTGSLSGSHTNASYQMQVCYLKPTKICLLGYTSVGSGSWSTCCNYTWNITFAAGTLTANAITKTQIKIPTMADIYSTTANYKREFTYWTSTQHSTNAWYAVQSGGILTYYQGNSANAVPYAIIDL
jgi:hypothetical protein